MMTASWRNFTVLAESVRVFTATSATPLWDVQTPLSTVPNWPEPRWAPILYNTLSTYQYVCKCVGQCVSLYLLSGNCCDTVGPDLTIEIFFLPGWSLIGTQYTIAVFIYCLKHNIHRETVYECNLFSCTLHYYTNFWCVPTPPEVKALFYSHHGAYWYIFLSCSVGSANSFKQHFRS